MSQTPKQHKGKYGEALALQFLEERGYTCREQNYRHGRSEIDLIMEKGELLVFVEVKYRRSDAFGLPETSVSQTQQQAIERAAVAYIEDQDWPGDLRFDIIAILHPPKTTPRLRHFEDAF